MLEAVKVGVLGLGTVGSGAANILLRNADEIARRAGRGIQISVACVRDMQKQRACDISPALPLPKTRTGWSAMQTLKLYWN